MEEQEVIAMEELGLYPLKGLLLERLWPQKYYDSNPKKFRHTSSLSIVVFLGRYIG